MNENQKYVCPKCNGLVDYGTRFCPHCGNAFGPWGNQVINQTNSPTTEKLYVDNDGKNSILDDYFSPKGRIGRKTFWVRSILLGFLLGIIELVLAESGILGLVLYAVISLLGVYSSVILGIKRWHDLNKSGWFILSHILILPCLYVCFVKGTTGPNKYGPGPLAGK